MTTIRRFPFFSHATGTATRVLVQGRGGELVSHGPGASFWFRPLGASISEVPVEDLEFGNIFRVTTRDRQEVSVQTALTVRIADPARAVRHLDFAVDVSSGEWSGRPLQTLQNRVAETAQQFAAAVVAANPLEVLLDEGLTLVRDAVLEGLRSEEQLSSAGVEVVGVRVVAVRPEEELERALQTKVREAIQAEADRATYDRRAQAVDRERAIKENELNNRTQLARREAELVELAGANERRRTQQELEREELRGEALLESRRLAVDARVDEIERVAAAENAALAAKLEAFGAADLPALLAGVFPEVVRALPEIDAVTLTPDLLGDAVTRALTALRAA
ncbi:SPFH domain-containing protein [Tessaracoccus terricola]